MLMGDDAKKKKTFNEKTMFYGICSSEENETKE